MRNKSWRVWLVMAICVLPVFFAYLFHAGYLQLPMGKKNKGILLDAPVDFSFLNVPDKKWRWVYTGMDDVCDSVCTQRLDELARSKIALGKYAQDVEVMYLGNETKGRILSLSPVLEYHPLALQTTQDVFKNGRIFLLDPFGKSFLYYEVSHKPSDWMKDVRFLLRNG